MSLGEGPSNEIQVNPKWRISRLKLPKAQKSGAVYVFAEQQPDSSMTFEDETSS